MGPGLPPILGLRRQGTSPGSPAGFLGSSGQGKSSPLLSCSSGPEGLPTCISCSPLSCHLMPPGPMQPRGVGLRLKEQEGSRRAPHPWSQRTGDLTWEPSRLPGLEYIGQTPSPPLLSCSSSLGGPLPPASPDLPSLLPMPPRTHTAWRGLWEQGDWPVPKWTGQSPSAPLLLFPEGAPPACLS